MAAKAQPVQRPPFDTMITSKKDDGKLSVGWIQFFTAWYTSLNQPANVSAPPATSSAPGKPGQIAYDTNFFYVFDATSNQWKRAALSAF
jgi:hypothetical protein